MDDFNKIEELKKKMVWLTETMLIDNHSELVDNKRIGHT